jgi:hypothetical protein
MVNTSVAMLLIVASSLGAALAGIPNTRCMVWVGSAVVTPVQGPQAANTVKVAKYYVGEG